MFQTAGIYGTIAVIVACFLLECSGQDWPPPKDTFEDTAASLVDKLSQSCDTSHLLARLILQETEARTKVEEQLRVQIATQENITKYQQELRTALDNLAVKSQEGKRIIAFSAKVSQHISGLTTSQTIVFGTAVTNLGNAYNTDTGVFRCPVEGVYQFYVSILTKSGNRIETELVVNGQNKLLLYSSSNGNHNGSLGSGTVILELQTGDEVLVRLHGNLGSYVHCCWSTFTGQLLH